MVLGFKKQFPSLILDGTKIHTIREDEHGRWHKGRKIHFATGARTKNYNQFHEGECKHVELISIIWTKGGPVVYVGGSSFPSWPNEVKLLAKNDGFESVDEFFKWFNYSFEKKIIIHWTDFKYEI